MSTDLLAGELALVTGAAGGIGRGIALALADGGARVVLCDLPARGGEDAASTLRAAGRDALFIATDLSAEAGPQTLLREVLAAQGCPTILVHAASPKRLERDHLAAVSLATWDEMLAVNLRAGFLLARAARRSRGCIGRWTKGCRGW